MQTSDVRDAALGAVDQSRSFLNQQVDARTTDLGSRVNEVAQDLRGVSDRLRVNSTIGPAAGLVDQGATYVERIGAYLTNADSEQLLADAESIVRAQPFAVAAGAFVVGFAASRFLKTSGARRYAAGTTGSGSALAPAYDGSSYEDAPAYDGTPQPYGAADDYGSAR